MSNPSATHTAVTTRTAPAVIAAGASTTQPHAELVGVTKRFGDVVALNNVSLQAHPGEVLAVLGPNGAGKTTAISTMLGLMKPSGAAPACSAAAPATPSRACG